MTALLRDCKPSDVRSAVEDFLDLAWTPADAPLDVGRLIRALDRIAYFAHGSQYEFDGADYPDPPDRLHSQTFSQAETWLEGLGHAADPDRHVTAVDDLADIIDDLESIRWRFENTSEADALREFELGFRTHWGHHLRSLQRILHDWYW